MYSTSQKKKMKNVGNRPSLCKLAIKINQFANPPLNIAIAFKPIMREKNNKIMC